MKKWKTKVEREVREKTLLPTSIFKRGSFKELWTNSDKCVTKTSLGSHFIPLFFPCLKRFKCGLQILQRSKRTFYEIPRIPVESKDQIMTKSYFCPHWWIIKITRKKRKSKRTGCRLKTHFVEFYTTTSKSFEKRNKLNIVVLTIRIPYRAYPPSCMFPITLRYGDVLTCDISWLLVSNLQQSYTYDISHFLHVPIIHTKM